MLKYMCPRNRPKFNTDSGLTLNRRGPAGKRSGSVPKGTVRRPPGAARVGVRRFFAPGTPASSAASPGGSGSLPADVDELAARPGRPSCAAGVAAVELAATAADLGMEASTPPGTAAAGPDVEPDAQPAKRGRRRVGRQVDIQADIARANPSTLPSAGPVATRR